MHNPNSTRKIIANMRAASVNAPALIKQARKK